jgi:hypothetical protein
MSNEGKSRESFRDDLRSGFRPGRCLFPSGGGTAIGTIARMAIVLPMVIASSEA